MKNKCNKKVNKRIKKQEKFTPGGRVGKRFYNTNSTPISIKNNIETANDKIEPEFSINMVDLKSEFNFLPGYGDGYTKCNGNENV